MLAKGRLLGLQFLALLNGEDGTGSSPYYTMAAKAAAGYAHPRCV